MVNTIRYATINLTNVTAVAGFSIQLSADNSTWTTVASNSGSASTFNKTNLYLLSGNQFLPYKYIRIKLEANQGYASVAEAAIYEGTSLISSFSGSGYTTGNPPFKAIDFDASTYFENTMESLYLTLQLSKSVKAIKASIIASVSNIKVSISGAGGNNNAYYYTLIPTEQFLLVNPGGIQTVTLSVSSAKIYDFTLEEFLVSSSIPPIEYIYDNTGNMTTRTILLSMTKAAQDEVRDTIIPANPELKKEKPYIDEFAGKKIFVYPIPTKGLLTIDFKNLDENDHISVQLYSAAGQKLLEKNVAGSSTILDLYNRANGTYFLNIQVNSDTHKWTIIKE